MTIITKPSLNIKKTPLIHENNGEDDLIEIQPNMSWTYATKRGNLSFYLVALASLIITFAGIIIGLIMYKNYWKAGYPGHRYRGFCTIPIAAKTDPQLVEPYFHAMPLRWSSDPDVLVFSTADEDSSDEVVNSLREEFDIGDAFEKISVTDNGRKINFIHDFDNNMTGIVDDERCFMMDLDLESVLPPERLVVGMQQGGEFDVSRVHTTLHAVLPALRDFARVARMLVDKCVDKPTYRLQKEEGPIIRKRSADGPQHDYMQFSGKHVQEIEIANMNDLLYYEQMHHNNTAKHD